MLALSRADLRLLVSMNDAVELMKRAFAELSAGRTISPLRTNIHVEAGGGDSLYMPAYVPAMDALGVKLVSVFPRNAERGLPTITALVCMVDPETGEPLAILDGTYLTALRTGAVSGAAADLLARPDAKSLVAIGAGAQGVTQVAAVCAVRPIERIAVVDINEAALSSYRDAIARDWPALADRVQTTTDSSIVADADVICTATTARKPVFDPSLVKPGTHINAIGAYTPEMQELPPEIVAKATVVVDAVDAVLEEAGDLIKPLQSGLITREHVSRELGQVVAGTAPARTSPDEITLFKSVGNAIQDVVVGRFAVDKARSDGVGTSIELA